MPINPPLPGRSILHLALAVPLLIAKQTSGQSTDPIATKDTAKVVFSGYVDAYYASYTDSVGDGNFQRFPTVSPRSEFGLNVAMISAQYDGNKFRGMVALQYGDIALSSWSPTYNNILEAHAGLRLCSKLWVDAGFFRTHFGTEGLFPKENITSSIAVNTYHEPYYESGIRLNYNPSAKLAINLYVMNGYNLYQDNNKKKSLGLLATYALGDKGNIGYANYLGDDTPTAADSISHFRFHQNLFVNYQVKKLKIQVGVDYCLQEHSDISDPTASASMISGVFTLKYQFTERFAVYAREEWFNDPEGFMGGSFTDKAGKATGLKLTGTTGGVEFKPTDASYVRLEGRQLMMDPDQEIFHWDKENRNTRMEVLLNLGVSF